MKLRTTIVLAITASAASFAPSVSRRQKQKTALFVNSENRRAFLSKATIATTAVGIITVAPQSACALFGPYIPKYDDVEKLYSLGVTLDNLVDSVTNNQAKALAGLTAWNKEPNFYNVYAMNYLGKSVKENASGDPRMEYVRQASRLVSGCQGLLEGKDGFEVGSEAGAEAITRIKKAQSLLAQFLAESGVEDDKIAKFVAEKTKL
mmetsp:Transcript_46525/g.68774  ORF Transcript_46525/g.68774 Transcript_46525/m.68774 type:complete len:206 (+) Transcript_46525:42-659(+)|eukprot:CAMPEP_0195517372 /NCGR_PEP_ID=MMETSP0794_2-20130614/10596_1 /TAXON_ID=515487 /ORGANISM="Stephanopyxis turris, Strain CCMP 815" /LENGTH=205 /DNA_ID=CAMNT_0040646163 /DNA_START=42 /DNA_END=659 /DNA_ORIENTATION=-